MPSCHTAIRTLCRNLEFALPLPLRLQLQQLKYTTTTSVTDSRRDESPPKTGLDSLLGAGNHAGTDLNKVTAGSAYLDFLLGSQDDGLVGRRTAGDDLEHAEEVEQAWSPTQNARRRFNAGNGVRERLRRRRRARIANPGQGPLIEVTKKEKPAFRYAVHESDVFQSGVERGRAKHGATLLRSIMPIRVKITARRLRGRMVSLVRRAGHRQGRAERKGGAEGLARRRDEKLNIASLARYVHKVARGGKSKPPVLAPLTINLVQRAYVALKMCADTGEIGLLLIKSPYWPSVALWFLHYDPITALDFLLAPHAKKRPHSHVTIKLAVHCLAARYRHGKDDANLKRLADALPTLSRIRGRPVYFHPFVYRATMDHLTDEALSDLYKDLRTNQHARKRWVTWLRFASSFTKRHKGDQALDALLEVKNAGGDVNNVWFRKVCSTLLRRAVSMPGGLRACIRIVDTLVKIDVTLDNNLTNIIMLNAVEAGDMKTAMDIYHSMRDHGLQPDHYTFAILLKACKSSIDDAELLNETIRAAISGANILEAPIVATEILHCLALHHTQHHPDNAFETVADAYAQLYTLAPLRLVGLLPAKLSHIENQDGQRRPPPRPQDIYILLATFLEQSFTNNATVTQAYEIWQRFKHAIEIGQEPFASMVSTDHIFNAFLCTFIKTKKGLLQAAEVVKYMQLPQSPDAKHTRIRPTVQTWSIFVSGFTRHGEMHIAEQLLTYMRGTGIRPNLVTYNILTGGYAKHEDLEGVMGSIKRLETDGFTWDRWTWGNLRRFRDQGRLDVEMKREKSLDFTEDLKQNLETRIEAFSSSEVDVTVKKVVDDHDRDAWSAQCQESERA